MLDEKYFKTLIFNGTDLRSFGLYLKRRFIYQVPEREISFTTIAGKSGDSVSSDGTFHNVTETYEFWLYKKDMPYAFRDDDVLKELTDWLMLQNNYAPFTDSWHKDSFSYAICTGISGLKRRSDDFLEGKISFSRIPWWYLNSGQEIKRFAIEDRVFSSALSNPTRYDSEPLIKLVFGGGSQARLGNMKIWYGVNENQYETYRINATEGCSEVSVDGESGEFRVDGVVHNELVSFDKLPKLANLNYFTVDFGGGVNIELQVVPRWRRV